MPALNQHSRLSTGDEACQQGQCGAINLFCLQARGMRQPVAGMRIEHSLGAYSIKPRRIFRRLVTRLPDAEIYDPCCVANSSAVTPESTRSALRRPSFATSCYKL